MMAAGRFRVWAAALAVVLMAAGAFAQEKPKIAVYVKGGMGDEVKAAFRNELLFAFVKSERYYAVDDNDVFVAAVKSEMERHGVSEMNDMQVWKAGEHVNADFVCVASVSPVLGGYQVFARVIDVKNEAVAEMGRGAGTIASVADVTKIAGEIVESMFGVSGKAAPQVQAAVQEQQAPAVATPPMETPAPLPKGPIKAAVYVTGVPDLVGKTLNSAISSALIKSKIYAGIESIDVSGAPSVPALADAGRNAGVSYIFTINVAGQISVAIIDVAGSMELAKISIDGKITAISAAAIAKKIVDFILTSGPKPDPDAQITEAAASGQSVGYDSEGKPRILKKKISVEAGGVFEPSNTTYSYSVTDYDVNTSSSFGVYLNVDLIYAECNENTVFIDSGVATMYYEIIAKYPFVVGFVKMSPILGYRSGYYSSGQGLMLGGRIDVAISEIAYFRFEFLGAFGDDGGSWSSLKISGGLDIGLDKRKRIFLRPELMYRFRYIDNFPQSTNANGDPEPMFFTVHSLELRAGIGYKWGGN